MINEGELFDQDGSLISRLLLIFLLYDVYLGFSAKVEILTMSGLYNLYGSS